MVHYVILIIVINLIQAYYLNQEIDLILDIWTYFLFITIYFFYILLLLF